MLKPLTPILAALILAGLTPTLSAAPEPEVIAKRWELRATFSDLRVAKLDVNGTPRAFYYMTYTIENPAGQDVLFAPAFEMVTGDGVVVRSGKDVSAEVTARISGLTGNQEVQDQIAIIGPLLQGTENRKEGVVVWAAANLRPGEVTVYAAGLSGESTSVKPPTPKNAEPVVLRKTRSLVYQTPGDLSLIGDQPIKAREDKWVMR
ncbi:hypothetical protein BH11PLA1_BH11PLA1_02660 [soil metagenome]